MRHARRACFDPFPMNADRDRLRRELRARRRELPAAQRIAAADALAERLLALPCMPEAGYVAGYWAMDGEIALHAWQLKLPRGCVYCLPVLAGDETLRFAPWRPGDALVTNRFGIPEPDIEPSSALQAGDMDFVAMPLVGFDAHGTRLGMGGGWYDRSFAFRRESPAPPWLVGVGFEAQRVDAIDLHDWDVRPDATCTESNTYTTTGAFA
jgi:5-formyltetrahydrofolate cyclo-ligase